MANVTNHRWHTIAINFTIVKPIVRTSPQPLKADLKFTRTHAHTHVPSSYRQSGAKEARPVLEERSVVRADVIGPLVSVATPRARSVLGCRSRGEPTRSSRTRFRFRSIYPSTTCVSTKQKEEEEESSCDRKNGDNAILADKGLDVAPPPP